VAFFGSSALRNLFIFAFEMADGSVRLYTSIISLLMATFTRLVRIFVPREGGRSCQISTWRGVCRYDCSLACSRIVDLLLGCMDAGLSLALDSVLVMMVLLIRRPVTRSRKEQPRATSAEHIISSTAPITLPKRKRRYSSSRDGDNLKESECKIAKGKSLGARLRLCSIKSGLYRGELTRFCTWSMDERA
jgi:hypothetical protein